MKNKFNFWVGVLVLLGIASLLFMVFGISKFSASQLHEGQQYHVTAYFDNIGTLKERAPVKSSGVLVGRVLSVALDIKSYRAKVLLQINQNFQFPKDSSIKILTTGILGDQYIGIESGAEDTMLADGDVVQQTQSAIVLENLIGQFFVNKSSEVK